MSSVTSSNVSVLLPAATIAVFSLHEETRSAVAALATDWRFARVRFDIRPGDVQAAIGLYSQNTSPNLLIVDTDVIDSGFTAQLEQLAGSCSEGTNAVVVGPVNDVAMYRYLINMGVSDYLVRPLQTPAIADVIGRILLEQLGASDSQLVAVIGAKGGVGASTIASLLAYGLAEVGGHKALVMDAAAGRSYLAVSCGTEPTTTMNEAARAATANDPNMLGRMLQKVGRNLQVLGTGNDHYLDDPIAPDAMERVLDRLLAVTPYVVADLSGAAPSLARTIIARAQRVILVSQPTLSSLRIARTLLNEIKEQKGGSFDALNLLINMSGISQGAEVGKADIEAAMDHKIALTVPFDPKVVMGAEAQAKVLGTMKGAEKMLADLIALMSVNPRATGAEANKASFLDTLFRKGGK